MRFLCILIIAICCSSCEHYDWSPSDRFIGQSNAPVITVGADLNLDDSDDITVPTPIPVTISDPNTALNSLQVSWSGSPANPGPVAIVGGINNYAALFPRNGTYQLIVDVSDGQSNAQESVIVTVNVSKTFAIDADISDNLQGAVGVPTQLQFYEGTVIENMQTDGGGNVRFDALIGSVTNYEVIVK